MTRFRGAALSKLEPCHKPIDQHEMPRRGEGALLRGKTLEQVKDTRVAFMTAMKDQK